MPKPTTLEELNNGLTRECGVTKIQYEAWGYTWPPQKGWLRRLKKEIQEKQLGSRPKLDKPVSYVTNQDVYSRSNYRSFLNSRAWAELRFRVLMEQGRKCVCCGATHKEAVMQVDHIIPCSVDWSKKLEIDNCQVLCAFCNRGKGNHYSDNLKSEE